MTDSLSGRISLKQQNNDGDIYKYNFIDMKTQLKYATSLQK